MPDKDKVTRFMNACIYFESGRVYFPKDKPFMEQITLQLKTFPNAKHDDIVDSIAMFLNWYNLKPKADVFIF
jgi:predicted phage terminase large subunit-like protein